MVSKKTSAPEEACSCNECKCKSGCCWCKVLTLILAVVGCVAAIMACLYACKSYKLNVLSAGWEENLQKMIDLYESPEFVKYMTEQTDASVKSFMDTYGNLDEDTSDYDDTEDAEDAEDIVDVEDTNTEGYASLNSLKSIAVGLGTNDADLQACIDEGRYTQAVNDMMTQASTLFGVNGTPGNVIIDRENGNYILIAGAYPADEFVNAINEYKNGAENFVAWGDEVKTLVEDMLKSTPIRGNKDARFTIVEYTELLCPFCQRHSQEGTINTVIEKFPEEVNSVSRHFIIHGDEALQLASEMECIAELNPDVYYKVFEEAFAKWL